ncbi:hypothetical protein FOA52_011170 [Chlamydomonas sp. UWO 241]|nr:hypothetical protein FOA52_011170 [Chlamydomonas sp. UWO 241]
MDCNWRSASERDVAPRPDTSSPGGDMWASSMHGSGSLRAAVSPKPPARRMLQTQLEPRLVGGMFHDGTTDDVRMFGESVESLTYYDARPKGQQAGGWGGAHAVSPRDTHAHAQPHAPGGGCNTADAARPPQQHQHPQQPQQQPHYLTQRGDDHDDDPGNVGSRHGDVAVGRAGKPGVGGLVKGMLRRLSFSSSKGGDTAKGTDQGGDGHGTDSRPTSPLGNNDRAGPAYPGAGSHRHSDADAGAARAAPPGAQPLQRARTSGAGSLIESILGNRNAPHGCNGGGGGGGRAGRRPSNGAFGGLIESILKGKNSNMVGVDDGGRAEGGSGGGRASGTHHDPPHDELGKFEPDAALAAGAQGGGERMAPAPPSAPAHRRSLSGRAGSFLRNLVRPGSGSGKRGEHEAKGADAVAGACEVDYYDHKGGGDGGTGRSERDVSEGTRGNYGGPTDALSSEPSGGAPPERPSSSGFMQTLSRKRSDSATSRNKVVPAPQQQQDLDRSAPARLPPGAVTDEYTSSGRHGFDRDAPPPPPARASAPPALAPLPDRTLRMSNSGGAWGEAAGAADGVQHSQREPHAPRPPSGGGGGHSHSHARGSGNVSHGGGSSGSAWGTPGGGGSGGSGSVPAGLSAAAPPPRGHTHASTHSLSNTWGLSSGGEPPRFAGGFPEPRPAPQPPTPRRLGAHGSLPTHDGGGARSSGGGDGASLYPGYSGLNDSLGADRGSPGPTPPQQPPQQQYGGVSGHDGDRGSPGPTPPQQPPSQQQQYGGVRGHGSDPSIGVQGRVIRRGAASWGPSGAPLVDASVCASQRGGSGRGRSHRSDWGAGSALPGMA